MPFDLIRVRQYDYDTAYVHIIIISNILGYCMIYIVCHGVGGGSGLCTSWPWSINLFKGGKGPMVSSLANFFEELEIFLAVSESATY